MHPNRLSERVKGSVRFLVLRRRADGFTPRATTANSEKLTARQLLRQRPPKNTNQNSVMVAGQRIGVCWYSFTRRGRSTHWFAYLQCACGRRCRALHRSRRNRWECLHCCGLAYPNGPLHNDRRRRATALKHLRKLSLYFDNTELVKPGDVKRPKMMKKANFSLWLDKYWLLWSKAAAFEKPWQRRVFAQKPRRQRPINDPALLRQYRQQLLNQPIRRSSLDEEEEPRPTGRISFLGSRR
jgi:hypothetical protein